MKSSIKRTYDRKIGPDGSVTLEYKGKRLNAHQVAGSGMAGVAILVGGIYWTVGLTSFLEPILGRLGGTVAMVVGVASTLFVLKTLLFGRRFRIILTRDGIIFPRSSYGSWTGQLAYADIDQLGVASHSSSGKNGFHLSTNVYASSAGTEVNITRFIPQTLSEAIIKEINAKMNESHRLANSI
ncbi:hypothetical protein ABIB38_001781 [Massilia sp. UYP11]|uniref:hypothetical protein n=1 Tax=Massilia sp. UYP11 TaxID=1756385 RepID=UPI003D21FA9E